MEKTSLERFRRKAGLLQKDVAAILGIPKTTYASYEQGRNQCDYGTLRKLARLYGTTIDRLLSDEEDPMTSLTAEQSGRLLLLIEEMERILEEAGIRRAETGKPHSPEKRP